MTSPVADPESGSSSDRPAGCRIPDAALIRLRDDEGGATSIEYALIVGLIFLAVVGALQTYANNVGVMYGTIETAIVNAK